MTELLPIKSASEITELRRQAVDAETLAQAAVIVEDVRARGQAAVLEHALRLGDIHEGQDWIIRRPQLEAAFEALSPEQQGVLQRTSQRIQRFAEAQRQALQDLELPVPGGTAGHSVSPVERAGCYAPGGRFPLPSSVLMTAVTARAAGVSEIWVASPRPTPVTLAAAAVAGADAVLAVGGAQAIAALAYGAGEVPACDALAGPGNRWVTAAKQIVAGQVRIDMLAGPSELVVIADASASAEVVAADLLAQAEHDPDALPVLISLDAALIEAVHEQLTKQLADLSTADIARQSLAQGVAVVAADRAQAADLSDRFAPEHLSVMVADPQDLVDQCRHYGAVFVGGLAGEVFGDYGVGPNHVLPTGGSSRSIAGLSVFNFLRIRTHLKLHDADAMQDVIADAVALAGLEGLEAHARSAHLRFA